MGEGSTIVRRWWEELWNERKLEVADEILATDFVVHVLWSNPMLAGPRDVPGIQPSKEVVAMWAESFPDFHVDIDKLVDAGDHVVCTHTFSGTHLGDFMGRPPTGRSGAVTGITLMRIADGKIAEAWTSWDMMGIAQKLGWMPKPGVGPLGLLGFVLKNIGATAAGRVRSRMRAKAAR